MEAPFISQPSVIRHHQAGNTSGTITGPALRSCAQFTADAAKATFSPKYSLFVQGLKTFFTARSGGYFGGSMDKGIGMIMLMAAPLYETIRFGAGIPTTIIGATSTAVVSSTYATECIGRKLIGPSAATIQRKDLTEKFIERLHNMLNDLDVVDKRHFKENPDQLVAMAAISIAFLSRGEGKKHVLKVGHNRLREADLEKQDDIRKSYFSDICEIKDAIIDMQLGFHDDHAWNYLITSLKNFSETKKESKEDEIVGLILEYAYKFSDKVLKDDVFKELWQKS